MVHDLIRSLDLLDFEELKERFLKSDNPEDEDGKSEDDDDNEADRNEVNNGDKQGADGEPQRRKPGSPTASPPHAQNKKATVVFPQPSLGTKACLLKYHDRSYIGKSSL